MGKNNFKRAANNINNIRCFTVVSNNLHDLKETMIRQLLRRLSSRSFFETMDSAFFHVCVPAYQRNCISNNNIKPRWISERYTNWKDATCEGRGFKGHQLLKSHKDVVDRTLALPTSTEDIGETLSSKHLVEKPLNYQVLLNILSNVQVLAQQALPLRGNKAGEINSNQLYC